LGSFLAKRFFALSEYVQKAIHRSLGMTPYKSSRTGTPLQKADSMSSDSESELGGTVDKTSALQQINVMLFKVCEGLVLVTQCIVTLSLESEMQRERVESGESTMSDYVDMKNFFNRKKYQENGMIESLIGAFSLCQSTTILFHFMFHRFAHIARYLFAPYQLWQTRATGWDARGTDNGRDKPKHRLFIPQT
jgi:ataxin-10